MVNGPPFTERSNRATYVACSGTAVTRTSTVPRTRWPSLGASTVSAGGATVVLPMSLDRV